MNNVKIFAGSINVASYLEMELGKVRISRFKRGEIYEHFEESIRNKDVFLIKTLAHPLQNVNIRVN